jgi:hypothetical protein
LQEIFFKEASEVAFGLNYNIKQYTKDTLFDEKIGGTMHMALGASLPESGGVNESGLHWAWSATCAKAKSTPMATSATKLASLSSDHNVGATLAVAQLPCVN